jgi:uncharacterized protein
MYFGREKELKRLCDAFASSSLEVIFVYGRRRVGKTELIKEALSRSTLPGCYYVCGSLGEKNDLLALDESLQHTFPSESFAYPDFSKAMEALFRKSETTPFVLALDEFPNLVTDVRGIAETLQNLIDEYKRSGKSKLKLIISGSYLKMMEKLLGSDGAFYKRETLKLLLRPMDYYDASLFVANRTPDEKAIFYAVFGGLPYCLAEAAKYSSVKEAIFQSVLNEGTLFDFDGFLTGQELPRLKGASEVFVALASGANTFSKLQAATSLKDATPLNRILTSLLEMDLIDKLTPINDKTNKKKTFYSIKDGYLLFYYTFIYPHLSALAMMAPEDFYDRFIEPTLVSSFVAKRFESITEEYLIRQNRLGKLDRLYEDIGTYWYDDPIAKKNGQFDVALKDGDHYLLVECKFTKDPLGAAVVNEEVAQSKGLDLGAVSLGFASRSGFELPEALAREFYCVSLDEMYR